MAGLGRFHVFERFLTSTKYGGFDRYASLVQPFPQYLQKDNQMGDTVIDFFHDYSNDV